MDISVDRIRGGHGSMENRKISKKRIALRVLALAVALVLAGGVYLTTQARIRFSRLNYVGQVAEYAANLTADERDTVDVIIRDYGDMPPFELRELSHSEAPWRDARNGLPDGASSHTLIDKTAMGSYYGGL